MGALRGSINVRLSRMANDANLSKEGMLEDCRSLAQRNGIQVIAEHIDDGLSGAIRDRPEFQAWLADAREGRADVLIAWHVDRMTREGLQVAAMLLDVTEGKNAEGQYVHKPVRLMDASGLDSARGESFRLEFVIKAELARAELERIKARAKARSERLAKAGRWRGGRIPYGYKPVKVGETGNWRLVKDEVAVKVLREIADRLVRNGESVTGIVTDLNRRGVPSPADRERELKGQPTQVTRWSSQTLKYMLESRYLCGETVKGKSPNQQVVRGADGLPIVRAEPIFDETEWSALQAALEARSRPTRTRTRGSSELGGIVYCDCGQPFYSVGSAERPYYRCKTGAKAAQGWIPCGNPTVRASTLVNVVEDIVMHKLGDQPVMRQELVKGEDHTAELEQVERALQELREDRAAGLYKGERGTAEFRSMYARLEQRREELEMLPHRADEWVRVPTGQTFGEVWRTLSTSEQKRRFLLDAKVKITVTRRIYGKTGRQYKVEYGESELVVNQK